MRYSKVQKCSLSVVLAIAACIASTACTSTKVPRVTRQTILSLEGSVADPATVCDSLRGLRVPSGREQSFLRMVVGELCGGDIVQRAECPPGESYCRCVIGTTNPVLNCGDFFEKCDKNARGNWRCNEALECRCCAGPCPAFVR